MSYKDYGVVVEGHKYHRIDTFVWRAEDLKKWLTELNSPLIIPLGDGFTVYNKTCCLNPMCTACARLFV